MRDARRRLEASSGLSGLELEWSWQDHQEWSESWKRGLATRRIGRRIVVTPSWCDPDPGPDDLVLVIDPGMAFGTAEHGTTRGCLRLLEPVVGDGERWADVGCGSGVLAIAAARLGAREVVAIESDPYAVEAARENVERNGAGDRVRIEEARATVALLASLDPFDGVLANIETAVLTALMPGFPAATRRGGRLILGGVLARERGAMVGRASESGFLLEEEDRDGEWWSGRFRHSEVQST